jgi:ribonuclease HII
LKKLFAESNRVLSPYEFDALFYKRGYSLIAGVDEVGRGPIAGPVVAAAVIFDRSTIIEGINDSKRLNLRKRELLFEEISKRAVAIGIGSVDPSEIDSTNILHASLKAMSIAVDSLGISPDILLIDGIFKIPLPIAQHTIKKGDSLSQSIGAASIVAKVTRDRIMKEYHRQYPQYGFDRHKGYLTIHHMEALNIHGCCPIHRKSFGIVKELIKKREGEILFPMGLNK